MARSCGIRIGPRRYELVVLDGSSKKHKIAAYSAGELPPPGEDGSSGATDVLKEALRAHRVPRENVNLAIDTANAAFRHLTLPFGDRSKIAQVVKFEVESQLPQWNVEDVVVDFHVLRSTDQSSELLVAAVPKTQVGAALEMCERAGVEPLDAELETSAMVNAAVAAQLCPAEEAVILVHVGEYSTSVVVVDGGTVHDMRVIHMGGLTHETVAGAAEGPPPAEAEATEAEPTTFTIPALDPVEVVRRVDQTIKRVRRELGRTISASQTTHVLTTIFVCGMDLPGMVGSTVLELPVRQLDCFEQEEGQPAEGSGAMVVAYGAALRGLGVVHYPASLRREELRYSGAMERIEFPLAVAALLLCFLLGVVYILQYREKQARQINAWYWAASAVNFLVGEPAQGTAGNLPLGAVPKPFADYLKQVKSQLEDPTRTPIQTLDFVNGELVRSVQQVNAALGKDGAIEQPQSAYAAACLVLDVLKSHDEEWRPSLRLVQSDFEEGNASRPDRVRVQLALTFFAANDTDATGHLNEFENELKSRGWEVDVGGSTPIETGAGITVLGMRIYLDVDKYFEENRQVAVAEEPQ